MDIRVFNAISRRLGAIEEIAGNLARHQEDLALKDWLDGQEVCEILDITKRTLQSYRDRGIIPFSRIQYKIFYKPEDVERLLKSSRHPNTPGL